MTSEDDIIIPLGVCAIKSKYRDRYLEMDFRGSEVRVSNDDILNSKKYFKAEKIVISDGTEKMRIFNIQPSTNSTLRKIGANLYTKIIDDFTLCGNECLFSITELNTDKPATFPTTNQALPMSSTTTSLPNTTVAATNAIKNISPNTTSLMPSISNTTTPSEQKEPSNDFYPNVAISG